MEKEEAVRKLKALKGLDGRRHLSDGEIESLLEGLSRPEHYAFIVRNWELNNQGLLESPPPLTLSAGAVSAMA